MNLNDIISISKEQKGGFRLKRLFIAIPITEASKVSIIKGILSDDKLKQMPVRWTSYRNLHLTIQFLGDVDEKRIPDLKQILNRIRLSENPEIIKFTNIGAFPGISKPRIIYLGLDYSDYLPNIQRFITKDLIRNGFTVDNKPFRPHLTLGRVREGMLFQSRDIQYVQEIADRISVPDSPVDRIVLFESKLQPGGPIYTSLYEKKLI